ncbi:MAG: MlaD family protein [Fibrobacteraceae bacterium]|nr:MlaD family protein [Fibrobacteraceae bacterium]
METTRTERIRLGIFLSVLILGALAFIGYVIGARVMVKNVNYYTVFSESVEGLTRGAKVMLNGIDVGRVTKIYVNPDTLHQVIVRFEVTEGTPIKTGTRINLTGGISLTGIRYLLLSGGDVHEADLPPESLVPAGVSFLESVTGQAEELAVKVETALNQTNKLLADENINHLTSAIAHLDSVMIVAHAIVKENRGPIAQVPKDLDSLVKETHQLVSSFKDENVAKKLSTALSAIDSQMVNLDLAGMAASMDKASRSIELLTRRVDMTVYRNQDDLNNAVHELRSAMENLNELSRKLRENPSLLLRSK